MKTRGFQLSRLTLNHFEFIRGLYDNGVINEGALIDLASEGLKGVPREAQHVLYPVNWDVVRLVTDHYRSGRKKIAIYMDCKGQRYVTADFLEPQP